MKRVSREMGISLDGVRDKNMMQLKKLTTAFFPVQYNDKDYAGALSSGDFTKLAYYSVICVGSIACRLEKEEGGAVRVYIMTLGVLGPYRGLGIGEGKGKGKDLSCLHQHTMRYKVVKSRTGSVCQAEHLRDLFACSNKQ